MADLAGFNKLFTELQNEVVVLAKDKNDFTQEIINLDAKVVYLKKTVGKLQDEIDEKKAKNQTTVDELQREVLLLKSSREENEKYIQDLHTKAKLAESTLHTMQKSTEEECTRLNDVIDDKKAVIAGYVEEIELHKGNLATIKEEVRASEKVAEVLDQQVSTRTAEVSAEINALEKDVVTIQEQKRGVVSQLDNKQDDLEELERKLEFKQTEFDELTKKHQEFLEYEKRANIALEARETAILSKEKELGMEIARANRRGAILDKIK